MMKMVFVLGEDFVKVADTKDVQPSHMKEIQADGENICVVTSGENTTRLAVFARMRVVL